MVAVWPETLPQKLLRQGNSEALGDGLIETQPDQGPPQTRRRFTAVVRPLTGAMNMSGAQIAALIVFREVDLIGGALPFLFPAPRGGDALLVKFPKGGAPSWSEIGADLYRVSINLTILP